MGGLNLAVERGWVIVLIFHQVHIYMVVMGVCIDIAGYNFSRAYQLVTVTLHIPNTVQCVCVYIVLGSRILPCIQMRPPSRANQPTLGPLPPRSLAIEKTLKQ